MCNNKKRALYDLINERALFYLTNVSALFDLITSASGVRIGHQGEMLHIIYDYRADRIV